jgi:hypothetical protein
MPPKLQISYYRYNTQTPIDDNHPTWTKPLPMTRNFVGEKDGISLTHGEYFTSVNDFLKSDDYRSILHALEKRLDKKVKAADISDIRVCLSKHGEFYHPARVDVAVGQQSVGFVLNVAVSDTGILAIEKEYSSLKRLNSEFDLALVPRVYSFGEARATDRRKIPMFLGDWLERYNEFHVSDDPSGDERNILVWDADGSRFPLSPNQQAELYRQAARILTYYYNVATFEQISGWHHAAGDFIVRADNTDLDLKLITVRRYAPHLSAPGDSAISRPDAETILQALMIFFLKVSIRMRLDRIDGVGEIVWADRFSVPATIDGFFEGLALKEPIPVLPDSIAICFAYYLSICTAEDLEVLCQSVAATFDRRAPETPVIRHNLTEHIASLSQSIEQFLNPS